jgi:hypothetical protein
VSVGPKRTAVAAPAAVAALAAAAHGVGKSAPVASGAAVGLEVAANLAVAAGPAVAGPAAAHAGTRLLRNRPVSVVEAATRPAALAPQVVAAQLFAVGAPRFADVPCGRRAAAAARRSSVAAAAAGRAPVAADVDN